MKQIVFTEDVCCGEPRIDGTRLSCSSVVSTLHFQKLGLDELRQLHPYLCPEEIWNCLNYCSKRNCVKDSPHNFCHGCTLDRRGEDSPAKFISSVEELNLSQ